MQCQGYYGLFRITRIRGGGIFNCHRGIELNIANEYVRCGIPSGLLIAVMYTSLWRICKYITEFSRNNHSIYLKNSSRCTVIGGGLPACQSRSSDMRAYDRRENADLGEMLELPALLSAAACSYLEERLISRQSAGETGPDSWTIGRTQARQTACG